jgi:hypothetical protein
MKERKDGTKIKLEKEKESCKSVRKKKNKRRKSERKSQTNLKMTC